MTTPLREVLDDVVTLPGVVGCCVVEGSRVQARSFPATFKDEKLVNVGKQMAVMARATDELGLTAAALWAELSMGRVLYLPVVEDGGLITVSDCETNPRLLLMSLQVARSDLREGLAQATSAAPEPAARTPDSAALAALRTAFTESMGPIASMLWEKGLTKWNGQGSAPDDLAALIDLLANEFDEEDTKAAFEAKARDLVASRLA